MISPRRKTDSSLLVDQPFSLRPYTRQDAPHVEALINAAAAQTLGVRRAVVDATGHVRLARYVPATSQKVVAVSAQGEVIGYAYLAPAEPYVVSESGGGVDPRYWGQGVGTLLVAWAEQQARRLAAQAPSGVKTVLQTNLFADEREAIQLFAGCGFRQVREWAHLVVVLDGPPPMPVAPERLRLRAMNLAEDWGLVGPAMDEAFADHWGAMPLDLAPAAVTEPQDLASVAPQDQSYSNSPGFCFVLMDGDQVAGGILCNVKLVERPDSGRVGSLFVRPAYRRQGAGRALMLAAFNAFWQQGLRRVITDTDAGSFTAAPRFYAALGMQLYRRELLFEQTIRPGQEVRRLDN